VAVEARGVTEVEAGFVLVEGGGGCVGLMFKKDLTLTFGKAGALGRAKTRYWNIRSTCWTSPEVLHLSEIDGFGSQTSHLLL
jgi:hypothetical protein